MKGKQVSFKAVVEDHTIGKVICCFPASPVLQTLFKPCILDLEANHCLPSSNRISQESKSQTLKHVGLRSFGDFLLPGAFRTRDSSQRCAQVNPRQFLNPEP